MANRVIVEDSTEEVLYKKERRKRLSVDRSKQMMLWIVLATVIIYLVCVLIPNPLGYLTDPNMQDNWISVYWQNLRDNIANIGGFMQTGHIATDYLGMEANHTVPWIFTFYLLVAGAAFAVSGAVYQGSFRNTIASPTTLGVISGGRLGCVLCFLCFYTDEMEYIGGRGEILVYTGMVCAGCFGAVAFTVFVSILAGRGKMSMVSLIVTGTLLSGSVNAITEYIQYLYVSVHPYDAKTQELRVALAGGIRGNLIHGGQSVLMMLPAVALIVIICLMGKRLNLLALGEDEAAMLGINVKRTRYLMVILCTLLTTSVLATMGGIAFIGLIIPNITRRLVGSDFRRLLPASAMAGAIFLMIVAKMPHFPWLNGGDLLSPMTSLIGGIMFIYLLVRNRRKRNADWAR